MNKYQRMEKYLNHYLKEVWRVGNFLYDFDIDYENDYLYKDLDLINELVERATAKKPNIRVYGSYLCPSCSSPISNNYCYNCGQAIDWSEK